MALMRWCIIPLSSLHGRARPVNESICYMSASDRTVTIQLHDTRRLRLAQVGWWAAAVVAAGILIAATPGYLFSPSLGVFDHHLVMETGTTAELLTRATNVASLLSATVSLTLAVFLFLKKRADPMGLFLAYYLLGHGIFFAGPIELLQPYWEAAPWVNSFILLPLFHGPMTMALITLFPDGRFIPTWSRWLIPISLLAVPASILSAGDTLPVDVNLKSPFDVILIVAVIVASVAAFIVAIYIQLYRYRKVSTTEQRLQTKWVLYGLGLWFAVNVVSSAAWTVGLQLPANTPVPVWLPLASLFWVSSSLLLPVALTISITRYRLFEIDLIINRTLVYGALTATVVAVYALSVGALSVLFQAQGQPLTALLATGLVAILFHPLRQRLQGAVNRLFYGQRDDPLEALSQLGQRLEATIAPEIVLPTLVETISQTLKLPYVAISLRSGDEFEIAAQCGNNRMEVTRIPLIYQGETVGQLLASPRGQRESFSQVDTLLLENIAHQAGPAAYAVQLTQDLRRSRMRLVTAREEERRRLRRDLHDGLGPVLASQGLKMAAVRQLLEDNPDETRRLLDELAAQNEATVAEIRRLVYELRPVALDDLGLVGAVRDYASGLRGGAHNNPRLSVDVQGSADSLTPLPAAIEVAAYRIATEALTNVARHARAGRAMVSFALASGNDTRELHVEIVDDGIGLPEDHKAGIGLISMRERAEEVGGSLLVDSSLGRGTRVVAELPLVEAL